MAIKIRKQKSLVGKIVLNSEITFNWVENCLKDNLNLVKSRYIFRYKFFVSYGFDENKEKEIKTVFLVKDDTVVAALTEKQTKGFNIMPYNIVIYLESMGIKKVENPTQYY